MPGLSVNRRSSAGILSQAFRCILYREAEASCKLDASHASSEGSGLQGNRNEMRKNGRGSFGETHAGVEWRE